jgi:creatinine amidohydrolase
MNQEAEKRSAIHRLEELSSAALDALDRARTVLILTISPLEQHGPHLPLGVDAFTAQYFAGAVAERIVGARPGWHVVLAPPLFLGSFTLDDVGTIRVRQRIVRDVLIDYGRSLARAGFRYLLIANGHAGPGHLVALEEAAARVSRRHRVRMASLSGHLAWTFRRGDHLRAIESALGRALSATERRAFTEDAHAGWWETSMMLWLRPELVDTAYRELPGAHYPMASRIVPNYPLRNAGRGYVGHPALGDPAFARATATVLLDLVMEFVDRLLAPGPLPRTGRSPFFYVPFLRTDFWPVIAAGVLGALLMRGRCLGSGTASGSGPSRRPRDEDDREPIRTYPSGGHA